MHVNRAVVGAVGRIIPEFGAINLNVGDLFRGSRAIAAVRIVSDSGHGFRQRFLDEGWNVIFLERTDSLGAKPRAYIVHGVVFQGDQASRPITVEPLPDTAHSLTEHGHDPSTPKMTVVPELSGGANTCDSLGTLACFLDDSTVSNVLAGGTVLQEWDRISWKGDVLSFDDALDRSGLRATLTDATGDWIKLNGVCYCQGNDCHK